MATETPTTPKPRIGSIDDSYTAISFVKLKPGRGNGRNWWSVPEIQDIPIQWQLGDALGREAVQFIRRHHTGPDATHLLLVETLSAMVKAGRWTATESGFARALSMALAGRG